jgi:hypothetical protein
MGAPKEKQNPSSLIKIDYLLVLFFFFFFSYKDLWPYLYR